MKGFDISILPGIIIKLIVAVGLLYLGIHLIRHNEIVTKNLLRNAGIFAKREISKEKIQISPKKLKFNRIMICIVGIVFTIGGILMLLTITKVVLQLK